jgi:hypothetical protein
MCLADRRAGFLAMIGIAIADRLLWGRSKPRR